MFRYPRPRRGGFAPVLASTRGPWLVPALVLVREPHAEFGGTDAADPLDDADALQDLGDEIATLAAHIHAATQRLLELIAEFDRRRGWEVGGHRSCAEWLSFHTGIDIGACREKVRTARVLEGLPETRAAMARGELSFSAVRALSRVATPENEEDLLALATGCTIAHLERTVRSWKRVTRMEEAELERERHESRSFAVFPDDNGMYVVRGRLPADIGALLMRALDAASDSLYRDDPTGEEVSDAVRRKRATQRRADGIGLLAECALAAGFGGGGGGDEARKDKPHEDEGSEECGSHDSAPISGTRAERYQVVLHVDAETLAADGEPGRSHLEDGTRVSAETSRRLSCDSGRVIMTHAPNGTRADDGTGADDRAHALSGSEASGGTDAVAHPEDGTQADRGAEAAPGSPPAPGAILSVGRKTRTISPALRRALDFRDRGCRFPGCGLRFTDAHHIKHWADGGDTSLSNCLLLCGHHHRLLHEGGWQVTWLGEGNPCFIDPRGGTHFNGRWQSPVLPKRPVEALMEANLRARGDCQVIRVNGFSL